jgi:hypothetical protein
MTDQLPAPIAPYQRPDALQIMFDERMFAQAMRVADMMSNARGFVPPHLAGKKEACFAVVVTAMTSGLNPYAIAKGTYQTPGGQVGYMGALVHAMLEASGEFTGPIKYEHTGDWSRVQGNFEIAQSTKSDAQGDAKYYAKRKWTPDDARKGSCGVTVKGTLKRDGEERAFHLDLAQCFPLNSTLWATDPKTQICYRAVRGFGNLAVPHIMMGIPGGDDDPAPQMIDVTPPAERPQLDEPAAQAPSDPPWQVTNQFGEVCSFWTPEPATSALCKILDGAAHVSMTSLETTMDNNGWFLDALSVAGERAARIELLAHYEQLKKSLQQSETSTISTAQPAETPSPTPTDAPSAEPALAADGMPSDISPTDHRFWTGASFAVACPKKGNAPDWRMYPLALGPRIRQAWTMALLNQLWRDNSENLTLFEQTQGALAAAEIKKQFSERKQVLTLQLEAIPFDDEK